MYKRFVELQQSIKYYKKKMIKWDARLKRERARPRHENPEELKKLLLVERIEYYDDEHAQFLYYKYLMSKSKHFHCQKALEKLII